MNLHQQEVTLEDLREDFRRAALRRAGVWIASEEDERRAQAFLDAHRPRLDSSESTNERGN